MGKKTKKQAYVVFRGKKPGIYEDWDSTNAQVAGFSCACHCGYLTMNEAVEAWEEHLRGAGATAPAPAPAPADETDLPLLPRVSESFVKSERDQPTTGSSSFKRQFSDIDQARSYDPELRASKILRGEGSDLDEGEAFENKSRITLSPEQEAVAQLALQGHNIFLTGAGGCGKTVTIQEIMARFAKKGIYYHVVAPTGISALPLGGTTTYSFMGWDHDSMRETLEGLLDLPSKKKKHTMKEPKVIIVEEISMVENQILERMNWVLQQVLNDSRPFGGKQVIILGDFHQLPPVKPFQFCVECGNTVLKSLDLNFDFTCGVCKRFFVESDKWAFKAPIWKALNLKHVWLEKIHRQKDATFKDILDKIRYGRELTAEEWGVLERKKHLPQDICAVRLMARRNQVDHLNFKEMAAIRLPTKCFTAVDPPYRKLYPFPEDDTSKPWETDDPRRHHKLPELLTLKEGAKVVLLANLDLKKGLVNGSQGVVVGFQQHNGADCEPSIYYGPQKQQRELPGSRSNYQTKSAPVVKFANGLTIPVVAIEARSRYGTNARPYLGIRVQVPLKLAWALTIHKSQGMTLSYLEVSSKDIFERGQLYVALSRGTSLEGVTLTEFHRNQLPPDEEVLNFYRDTNWETFDEAEDDERKVKLEDLSSDEQVIEDKPLLSGQEGAKIEGTQIKNEHEHSQAEGSWMESIRVKSEPVSSNEAEGLVEIRKTDIVDEELYRTAGSREF